MIVTGAMLSPGVDQRLVARAQARAGSRAHKLANLLSVYFLWARMLEQAVQQRQVGEIEELSEMREQAESAVRRFAFAASGRFS